jgi:CheY-like chemotaxis protein
VPNLLIVDDNENNRDLLSRRLRSRGFEVIVARDGIDGLAVARSEKPDVILMDLNMPALDGWEAVRLLKQAGATRDIPVIALTAYDMAVDRARALQAGCAAYYTKPVDFRRLVAQIEAVLEHRAAARCPAGGA